jgi:hypothetical protein
MWESKVDKDYRNFAERMGSFEDDLDLSSDDLKHSKVIVTRNRSAIINEDEITHFGIKGMRWGRRSNFVGPPKPKHRINTNDFNAIGASARAGQSVSTLGQTINRGGFNGKVLKTAKSLSDDDLKKLTNRLNLENNYMNATTQQAGRSKVESILSTAGATFGVVASAALMVDAISKARG